MEKALVIFSGGQDSTTCLGWAQNRFAAVTAIAFFYGQRHEVEIRQAKIICEALRVPLNVFDVSFYRELVPSALIDAGDLAAGHELNRNLPAAYVPNRNALFVLLAHAFAQKIGAGVLVAGFCETDYSGYPDCRTPFVKAMEKALNLGSEQNIRLLTPLMHLTKAETFALAASEGVYDLVINESHTCYEGISRRNEWGRGCGVCPACLLRRKGYEQFRATPGSRPARTEKTDSAAF